MASVRIQGENERRKGIYYEYDPADAPLGEGGMGKVYRGWCCSEMTNQRREVAIKFLYSDLPPHVIARARREAAVQLRNDNLIEMLGFVEINAKDEVGQPIVRYHVISEYLHGVTLDKLLAGNVCDSKGNIIPFAQELYGKFLSNPYGFALTVVRNLLSGLIALHDGSYIHRDIDPSNVMVTSDGKIKLIDFGIAKKLNGNNTKESSYTVDGQFIGKPKYAAPELVRGLVDSQNVTTDIYAVGILLYQLLTGTVPFDGEMAEVMDMQLNKKMPLHNVKQKQIREVIKTATQKKRSLRYQSAAEFRVAVDRLVPLQYPAKVIDVKTVSMIAVSAAALVGLIMGGVSLINRSGTDEMAVPDNDVIAEVVHTDDHHQQTVSDSYQRAVTLMSDKSTAGQGLSMLRTLADNRDYQSAFLLSRLYFNSNESVRIGDFSDSIALFRNNLGMKAQNQEAHRLLKNAVSINSMDYRSLYELGCDYKSKRRGATFNPDSAYIYLSKAKQLAVQAGDQDYEREIAKRMVNLKPVK
ncbi:MAG: serine/threonine protein kinase [Pseudoflavonifractor sp.]|nr:serine/threonine protein kinase [Pseudoflavonifractor sp.]